MRRSAISPIFVALAFAWGSLFGPVALWADDSSKNHQLELPNCPPELDLLSYLEGQNRHFNPFVRAVLASPAEFLKAQRYLDTLISHTRSADPENKRRARELLNQFITFKMLREFILETTRDPARTEFILKLAKASKPGARRGNTGKTLFLLAVENLRTDLLFPASGTRGLVPQARHLPNARPTILEQNPLHLLAASVPQTETVINNQEAVSQIVHRLTQMNPQFLYEKDLLGRTPLQLAQRNLQMETRRTARFWYENLIRSLNDAIAEVRVRNAGPQEQSALLPE